MCSWYKYRNYEYWYVYRVYQKCLEKPARLCFSKRNKGKVSYKRYVEKLRCCI